MCSYRHLAPEALIRNLLEFYLGLERWLLLHYVPNIVCLTLIGSWYKKCLTKDYIWVHFVIKKLQKEIQGGLEKNVSKSSRAEKARVGSFWHLPRPQLRQRTRFGGHSSSCREDAVAVSQEQEAMHRALILGSSPATFLGVSSAANLRAHLLPGAGPGETGQLRRKVGSKVGSLDSLMGWSMTDFWVAGGMELF